MRKCVRCGLEKLYRIKEVLNVKSNRYDYYICDSCLEAIRRKPCPICRKRSLVSNSYYHIMEYKEKWRGLHEHCVDIFNSLKDTSNCPKCHKKVINGIFHKKCFKTCKLCYKVNLTNNDYCDSCKKNMRKCKECGKYKIDFAVMPDKDIKVCELCFSNIRNRIISRYNQKFDDKFFPEKKETSKINRGRKLLYLGVELEVESKKYKEAEIGYCFKEKFKDINLKHDGSLTSGFELNSFPATLWYHKEHFQWKEYLKFLRDNGCLSHNTTTCGLHVHINREFLNTADIMKLTSFIHSQHKRMIIFGRRGSNSFTKWKRVVKGFEYQKDEYNKSKYDIVNARPETVEIRLFRGTLKYSTFMATLEFCDAISRFVVKEVNFIDLVNPDKVWDKFVKYIEKNKYKYLLKYLNKLKLPRKAGKVFENNRGTPNVTRESKTIFFEGSY